MRTKSLIEPKTVQKGDEWLSPDGYSPSWRRGWNGEAWVEDLKVAGFPLTDLSPNLSAEDLSDVGLDDLPEKTLNPESLERIEIEISDESKPPLIPPVVPVESVVEEEKEETEDTEEEEESTEETKDEQRVQTEVSDSNRSEQGSGGKPEPKQEQRGKRGKVRKGRQGK